MSTRLVLDHAGLDALMSSPGVQAAVTHSVQDAARIARSLIHNRTGRTGRSIRVEPADAVVRTRRAGTHLRTGQRLILDVAHGQILEWGRPGQTAQQILNRTADIISGRARGRARRR